MLIIKYKFYETVPTENKDEDGFTLFNQYEYTGTFLSKSKREKVLIRKLKKEEPKVKWDLVTDLEFTYQSKTQKR